MSRLRSVWFIYKQSDVWHFFNPTADPATKSIQNSLFVYHVVLCVQIFHHWLMDVLLKSQQVTHALVKRFATVEHLAPKVQSREYPSWTLISIHSNSLFIDKYLSADWVIVTMTDLFIETRLGQRTENFSSVCAQTISFNLLKASNSVGAVKIMQINSLILSFLQLPFYISGTILHVPFSSPRVFDSANLV